MGSFAEWPPAAKALGLLFGAMLLACVWSLLASTVFLVGTNMLGNRHQLAEAWHRGVAAAEGKRSA